MDLANLVERSEMEAWRDMVAACPAPLAEGLGLKALDLAGGLAIVAPRVDVAEFNRIMGVGLARPATEADLDAVIGLYRPLGLQSPRLQLAPQARPTAELPAMLAAKGFVRTPLDWVKMARPCADAPQAYTGLTLVEAGAAEAPAFASTVCCGFGMPPMLEGWLGALVGRPDWRCYVAFDGEAPAAAGALYLGDDYGWLGIAATRPDARRRGGQGSLMARRIADAAAAGKAWAVTETGAPVPGQPSPSHDNMVRYGFELVHRRANYTI